MEKFFAVFKLGLKYLYRYRRRYGFLMTALVFCYAIITVITSVKDGMYDSVYYTAQSHYAGDIIAIGYDDDCAGGYCHHLGQEQISAVLGAADLAGINPRYTVLRTMYYSDGVVHFNGSAVTLKYLTGCDWDNEAHLLDKMDFEDISAPLGDDGVILSAPSARQIGARMGDSVILELDTRRGQKNTGVFIVKGIVRDNSIFGYFKAYISRLSLNRLIMYEDGDCSSIGFFFDDSGAVEQKRRQLQNILSQKLQIGPLVYDRDGMQLERGRPWKGVKVFLYTLPVYLSEISGLLGAMNIVTYLLYAMMLIIISVSAAVTYRLILHERAREMGVMRVIGFYGSDLRMVLWSEVFVIGVVSLAVGFLLALILGWAVSLMSFSWFPGFDIFLRNGRLMPLYSIVTTLTNIVFIIIMLAVMALFPSFRASRKNLPGLLSGEPL